MCEYGLSHMISLNSLCRSSARWISLVERTGEGKYGNVMVRAVGAHGIGVRYRPMSRCDQNV